ncbi:Paraneoplastic antigen-like protein 5 [Pteropus alecto]|uniref:Paraneoplastic antigen-like protein 5 n=1 Tax=Pteropus alecto TaxID=9402 RepID=L5L5A0_PTEAL|nr:Paraneoplastic antigen-like protein 5 [Pteropus alecto]
MDQRCKHAASAPGEGRAQAVSSHTATAEAEEDTAGDSDLDPDVCPPVDTYALGCELRMQTGRWAPWGLEEPSPGNLSPREAGIGPEELQGREVVAPLRRGDRRVQPVFRIVYTALGEPQEGSTDEPLRQ